ncbi:YbaK domain protein [Natronomonas pharaonis DSM 2160]|uniref:YbaK domain protein n=1 Tax=Natronomonas pharaonis (strain ATCC 35678 / DSM 2160 / CIP 103997 / JCM 8858 / NBRC 14720 / NCIMB 2260 / Gabara) TaxID=348780 RepID=A0A1U7EWP9_NATPD|nr:YbaK/EbsC family protein [Natronomonas pharaonis]CAI49525.1 YbaK domain protein [Natronomonas pharaonis DSM 2160]
MHPRTAAFREHAEDQYGLEIDVHEFPEGTKTAADAADAVGCDLAQIASGIVFDVEGDLVVVVTSGANRVSEPKLAAECNVDTASVSMADADDIKETLGWAIGGVPPFCHETDVPVYMDETLTQHDDVWAAAGTPEAVFPIPPAKLRELADAAVVDVAE